MADSVPVLAGHTTIDDGAPLPDAMVGGVRLVGDNGRIVCDNTLRTRLDICIEEQLPAVRASLFPSMKTDIRDFSQDAILPSH